MCTLLSHLSHNAFLFLQVIIDSANAISETGKLMVTYKGEKTPKELKEGAEPGNKFVLLNGIWRYWEVFIHLSSRTQNISHENDKIDRHVATLKALNNLFSMLSSKLGMPAGHYRAGATDVSGTFKTGQFIDTVSEDLSAAAC